MRRSSQNRPRLTHNLMALSRRSRLLLAGSLAVGTTAILIPALLLPGITFQAAPSSGAGLLSPSAQVGAAVPTAANSATTPAGSATFTASASSAPGLTQTSAGPVPAGLTSPAADSSPLAATSAPVTTSYTASPSTVYMHYYLWWTPLHWHDKLGSSYPYSSVPAPAPGSMSATGCNPTVTYPGATIIDVPSEGLYDQNQAATFDRHIAAAVGARVTGFLVNWQGTGQASQAPSSSGYNARLDLIVARVNAYNSAHGTAFRLALALDAFGNYSRSATAIINDINYFRSRYAGNVAFADRYGGEPMVMLMASRQFALVTIQAVSSAERSHVLLLGDETYSSWNRDAAYLDGTGYYWSSQDPWNNPQSGQQIGSLASQVHSAGKAWFSPFTGGFNTQLNGGTTCVPRNGVKTLDAVWSLNVGSAPQGWFGISWNEFVENTYLEPSSLYGPTYLNEIARLIGG